MERTLALGALLAALLAALAYKLMFDAGARLAVSDIRFPGSGAR